MSKEKKFTVQDAFGKEHEFDYTNATSFAYDIFSKNARVLLFIQHNDKKTLDSSHILESLKNDLELEWPIINQYIPTGNGLIVDIYKKVKEDDN